LNRDGRAERLAEQNDALAEGAVDRRAVDGPCVLIEPLLRWRALRAAVAPVVDEEDVETESTADDRGPVEPIADVSGVAVKKEQPSLALAPNPPTVERGAVFRADGDFLGRKAVRFGRSAEVQRREVESDPTLGQLY
jgi:hypothetical protein